MVRRLAIGVVLMITGICSWIYVQQPAPWLVAQTEGVDKYAAHVPFYGSKSVTQSFTTQSPSLSQIAVLVVDLKHANNHSPISLSVYDADSHELLRTAQADGKKVKDDYYIPFRFEPITDTAGKHVRFTISASDATKDAPYAVRRTMDASGNLSSDFAFSYFENKTVGYVWEQWITHHTTAITLFIAYIIGSAALLFFISNSIHHKRILFTSSFIVITTFGILLQLHVAIQLYGDPGGDSYYYMNTANDLVHGVNPFVPSTFRLPMYSVTLLPALIPHVPDFWWGRILGIIASIGVGAGLILLAKALRLHPGIGVVAYAWLYFNTHYLVTSVRPRPYELFAALLLFSCSLLFFVRTYWQMALWGLLLGIMGMTRQESFIPIALLVLAFIITRWREHHAARTLIRQTATVCIPLAIMMLPYFYYNYVDYGSPFFNAYSGRSDIQAPHSISDFLNSNIQDARDVVGTSWLPSYEPDLKKGLGPLFTISCIAGLLLAWFYRLQLAKRFRISEYVGAIGGVAALWLAISWIFFSGESWTQYINVSFLAAILIGIAEFIRIARWRGALIVTILATQLFITTWFQTQGQHFQQSIPFLSLLMITGLFAVSGTSAQQKPWRTITTTLPIVCILGFFAMINYTYIGQYIDALNVSTPALSINVDAAEWLHEHPGIVVSEMERDSNYYFHSYLQQQFIPYESKQPLIQEQAWLCTQHPDYLVDHEELALFTLPSNSEFSAYFIPVFTSKAQTAQGNTIHTTVYSVASSLPCR